VRRIEWGKRGHFNRVIKLRGALRKKVDCDWGTAQIFQ